VTVIPRSDWTNAKHPVKGTWVPVKRTGGKKTARMSCPLCGFVAYLDQHVIDENGVVRPSVDCPVSTCRFHDFVKLGGWNG
jgi:hypothetical protein